MTTQVTTVLTLNLASDNAAVNKKYGPWSKRVIKAGLFIRMRGATFVCCQELYADKRPALDKLLAKGYTLDSVRGGRVIYRRKASNVARIGGSRWTDLLPGKGSKYAVARKYRFESGAILNLANAHLSFETNNVGVNKRAREVPAFVKWVRAKFPTGYDLYVGDFNSPYKSTTRRDDVGPIFTRYGLHDLGRDVNAEAGPGNYHLDRGFAGRIKARTITIHKNDFTDHPGAVFRVEIPV